MKILINIAHAISTQDFEKLTTAINGTPMAMHIDDHEVSIIMPILKGDEPIAQITELLAGIELYYQ